MGELNAGVAIVGLLTTLALTGCETGTEPAPEDPQGISYSEMEALRRALYDGILDMVYGEPLLEAARGATRGVTLPPRLHQSLQAGRRNYIRGGGNEGRAAAPV